MDYEDNNDDNITNDENIGNDENDKNYQPEQENDGVEHPIDFSEVIQFAARFNLSTFVMSAFTNLVAKGGTISEGIFDLVPSYKWTKILSFSILKGWKIEE